MSLGSSENMSLVKYYRSRKSCSLISSFRDTFSGLELGIDAGEV